MLERLTYPSWLCLRYVAYRIIIVVDPYMLPKAEEKPFATFNIVFRFPAVNL